MTRGEGARLWDVDGHEYIDYCQAFGPQIAGHGHPRILEAVAAALAHSGTTILGTPTPLEITLAERLSSLIPSAEMVRFTNSGTESTMHGVRRARVRARLRVRGLRRPRRRRAPEVLCGAHPSRLFQPARTGASVRRAP